MTSVELKHQEKLKEWTAVIQECRSSGQPVKQWCKENGVAMGPFYRWEKEIAEIKSTTTEESVVFAQLPALAESSQPIAEPSATLRIGDACLEFHQKLTPAFLKTLVEVMRSC